MTASADVYCDNTQNIRFYKNSSRIRQEIEMLRQLKRSEPTTDNEREAWKVECQTQCLFLYTYFTQMFQLLLDSGMNFDHLEVLLRVLEDIENGILDQHDASVKIGQFLKTLYIDAKIAGSKEETQIRAPLNSGSAIGYKAYKSQHRKA